MSKEEKEETKEENEKKIKLNLNEEDFQYVLPNNFQPQKIEKKLFQELKFNPTTIEHKNANNKDILINNEKYEKGKNDEIKRDKDKDDDGGMKKYEKIASNVLSPVKEEKERKKKKKKRMSKKKKFSLWPKFLDERRGDDDDEEEEGEEGEGEGGEDHVDSDGVSESIVEVVEEWEREERNELDLLKEKEFEVPKDFEFKIIENGDGNEMKKKNIDVKKSDVEVEKDEKKVVIEKIEIGKKEEVINDEKVEEEEKKVEVEEEEKKVEEVVEKNEPGKKEGDKPLVKKVEKEEEIINQQKTSVESINSDDDEEFLVKKKIPDDDSEEEDDDISLIESSKKREGCTMSRSRRAGLSFPVTRLARLFREGKFLEKITAGACVYMAAVLEYLSAEVSEISGFAAKNHKNGIIYPKHIQSAIRNDKELNLLLSNNIHMLNTNTTMGEQFFGNTSDKTTFFGPTDKEKSEDPFSFHLPFRNPTDIEETTTFVGPDMLTKKQQNFNTLTTSKQITSKECDEIKRLIKSGVRLEDVCSKYKITLKEISEIFPLHEVPTEKLEFNEDVFKVISQNPTFQIDGKQVGPISSTGQVDIISIGEVYGMSGDEVRWKYIYQKKSFVNANNTMLTPVCQIDVDCVKMLNISCQNLRDCISTFKVVQEDKNLLLHFTKSEILIFEEKHYKVLKSYSTSVIKGFIVGVRKLKDGNFLLECKSIGITNLFFWKVTKFKKHQKFGVDYFGGFELSNLFIPEIVDNVLALNDLKNDYYFVTFMENKIRAYKKDEYLKFELIHLNEIIIIREVVPNSNMIILVSEKGDILLLDILKSLESGSVEVKVIGKCEIPVLMCKAFEGTKKIAIGTEKYLKIFSINENYELSDEIVLNYPPLCYDIHFVGFLEKDILILIFKNLRAFIWMISEKKIIAELNIKPKELNVIKSFMIDKSVVVHICKNDVLMYNIDTAFSFVKSLFSNERLDFVRENLSDVQIFVENGDKIINTFKYILCRSSYLKDKLVKEDKIVESCNDEVIDVVLKYLTGLEDICIEKENILDIYLIAEKWKLKYLQYLCLKRIMNYNEDSDKPFIMNLLIHFEEEKGDYNDDEIFSDPFQLTCLIKIKNKMSKLVTSDIHNRLMKSPKLLYKIALFSKDDYSSIETLDYFKGIDYSMNVYSRYCSHLRNLFQNGKEMVSNLTLKSVDKHEFHVHKQILILRSEYFYLIFRNNFEESNKKEFEILEMNCNELKCYLEFIYTRKISDLRDNFTLIFNLLKFSDKYLDKILEHYLFNQLESLCLVKSNDILNIVYDNQHKLIDLPIRLQEYVIKIWEKSIVIKESDYQSVIKMIIQQSTKSKDRISELENKVKSLNQELELERIKQLQKS